MRRCLLAALLMVALTFNGCAFVQGLFEKPEGGGKSVAEVIQDIARALPYGEIIASGIGLIGIGVGTERHIKHKKTAKENQALKAKLPPPTIPPAA